MLFTIECQHGGSTQILDSPEQRFATPVAIVYYPGVEHLAELVQSKYFTGIIGGKQLGDTLTSTTVPLLPPL